MSERRARVLIVDDDPNACGALVALLDSEGYVTETANDGVQALRILEQFEPDVVLTDLHMPELDGMGLLEKGRKDAPHAAFVVMTAFGSIDIAVQAIQRGAENFLTKPLDLDAVAALVDRAAEKARLSREAAELRSRVARRFEMGSILGEHATMQRLMKTVAQVAPSRSTVLLCGESGTGKELIASAIHQNSARAGEPFVRLNCAALAEGLLESELFGHERGAFSGAVARREGRFMQADGGTLFLDEVSEIPVSTQVKLLRFLQERQFERVGSNETLSVDVRIVAASNRDLRQMVKERSFREDLYYRLNVVQIDVPPLRVRRSDIPLLANYFLRRVASENARPVTGFTDEALRCLLQYPWPGNVRELENAVERAVILSTSELVVADLLPGHTESGASDGTEMPLLVPGVSLAELERLAILQTLEATDGDTAKTAELLGVSRRKIQYRLKEWGMTEAETDTLG